MSYSTMVLTLLPKTSFNAFNLYKSNKRSGYEQMNFYCLQAVTLRIKRTE